MRVQRDGRNVTVEVTADGEGLVSHAGSALLAQVADKSGLTPALSVRLEALKQRRCGHDPGRVVRDLAVMLAVAVTACRNVSAQLRDSQVSLACEERSGRGRQSAPPRADERSRGRVRGLLRLAQTSGGPDDRSSG